MKKNLVCLLMCAFSLCASTIRPPLNTNLLRENQIENYAQNVIETLFYNSVQANQDKQAILRRVKKQLLTPNELEQEYHLSVERTQEQVYQTVLQTIVDYVTKESFDQAKKATGDYRITMRAQDRVTSELINLINSTGEFAPGALNNFVGENLRSKIKITCYQFDTPYVPNFKRFDEKSCRICLQHFKPTLTWVYLRPCGHDMCTGCAYEYFVKQGKNRCPACNQRVDIHNLKSIIQAKA